MQANPNTRMLTQRVELKQQIANGGDWVVSLSDILSGTGISEKNVLIVYCEGARPEVSWTEVQPITFYNSTNNSWGIHNNNGTGGVVVATFIIVYGNNFI